MKKINYRKLSVLVLWIMCMAGLMVSLAFVSKSERNVEVKRLRITIANDENPFVSESDIRGFLEEKQQPLMAKKFSGISIPTLERLVNSHPAVENGEVCATVDGEVRISVRQRTPVCRIINKDGESYYIDSQSRLMPLNENYTARVLVVNGEISEPFARRYQFSVDQISKNAALSSVSMLDDIMRIVRHVNSDSTLAPLIQQVYVNSEGEFELFPAVGGHRIIFGTADNIQVKFNKLKLFYTEGLNKSDSWTKYSVINLKFRNLVVCTKK